MALIKGDQNGPQADALEGTYGNDTIYGYELNDHIAGNLGDDLIYGGSGDDYLSAYHQRYDYYLQNRELGTGNDTLYGEEGDDFIYGSDGDNVIYGGTGNDQIDSGFGDDRIHGGSGNDIIYAGDAGEDLDENWEEYTSRYETKTPHRLIDGGEGSDYIINFNAIEESSGISTSTIYGGNGNDTITDYSSNGLIYGGAGKDYIDITEGTAYGGDGDDYLLTGWWTLKNTIYGDAGRDTIDTAHPSALFYGDELSTHTIHGGLDNDTYITNGHDIIIENANEGHDIVRSYGNHTLANNVEDVILIDYNFEPDLSSSDFNPNATGNVLNNKIIGNKGNNILDGMGGKDKIIGDAGHDTIYGGTGHDKIDGGAGSDLIIGGTGIDRLYGGHNDQIGDIFVFNSASDSTLKKFDTVYDFVSGQDKIDLSMMTGDNITFNGTSAGQNSIWYSKVDADVMVYADLTGDAKADFALKIANINSLTGSDFSLLPILS